MKYLATITLLCLVQSTCLAQQNEKISTIDYVQILNGNEEETIYYYKNNWEQLRKKAVEENYIESYRLLKLAATDQSDYQIILLTTYANQKQFDKREDNFGKLIEARGERNLLNKKQPGEFRKVVNSNESVRHLE